MILAKIQLRPLIISLHLVLFAFIAMAIYTHTDSVRAVKMPPSSLSQWYKPENKRQVWLHNMFKLRREMQAIAFYAEIQDSLLLAKWTKRLNTHYFEIEKMVPEWKEKLSSQILADLNKQVKHNKFNDIPNTLEYLSKNCQGCHTDYQATTAALYRAPDFSNISVHLNQKQDQTIPYVQHMDLLSKQVNQIKIAIEDDMIGLAQSSLSELKLGMVAQGNICSNCHKNEVENYPSKAMIKTLEELDQSLVAGSLKDQGRALGTLAVQACARCHGTHRMSYNARKLMVGKMDWLQLIKH